MLINILFVLLHLIIFEGHGWDGLINFWILGDVFAYGDLDKGVVLLNFDALQDHVHKTFLRLSLEVSPSATLKDLFLVNGEEVDAVLLKLVGIVSVSYQQYLKSCAGIDKLFQVAGTYLDEARQHEIVSVDEESDEELSFLSLDVEVIRINILDDTIEIRFGDTHHIDHAFSFRLLSGLRLHEGVFLREHVAEVDATSHENQAVCFNQRVVNIKDDVVELVKVLALVHVGKSFVMKSFVLVFRWLNVRVLVRLKVHLDMSFKLLYFESQLFLLGRWNLLSTSTFTICPHTFGLELLNELLENLVSCKFSFLLEKVSKIH